MKGGSGFYKLNELSFCGIIREPAPSRAGHVYLFKLNKGIG